MYQLAEAATGFDALMQNLTWTIGVAVVSFVLGFGVRHFFVKQAEKIVKTDIDGDGSVG